MSVELFIRIRLSGFVYRPNIGSITAVSSSSNGYLVCVSPPSPDYVAPGWTNHAAPVWINHASHWDWTDQVEKVLRCDLSGWQRSLYKQIQESGAFGIAQEQVGKRYIVVFVSYLGTWCVVI